MTMAKARTSKRDRIAAEHDAFLRAHGIAPGRRKALSGAITSPLTAEGASRTPTSPGTSGAIPGNGGRRDLAMRAAAGEESPDTLARIAARQQAVAQPYAKGPFMLVTDPDTLKTNMRRPAP